MNYVGALIWGFVVLGGFQGYGMIVGRVLGRRFVDGGLAIAWGLSLLIVLGGVLNLARLISPALVVGLVLTGQVGWIVLGGPGRLVRAARRLSAWDYLTLAILLMGYVNWLCFNSRVGTNYSIFVIDDSSYTLFPKLMLDTGSMGIDPFNDRLTMTGFGGQAFLQVLILAVFPLEYIHLADPGIVYPAIGVFLFSGWFRRLTAPARAILAMLFASIPTATINASAVAMPIVLLLAIVRELEHNRPGGLIRSGAGVALPLAALLTLKTTLVPAGILLVFFRGLILALTTRRVRPLLEGVVTAVFLLVMLLPWMVSSSYSSGSVYYPFLGEGFRANSPIVMPQRALVPARTLAAVAHVARSPQTLVILFGLVAASFCTLVRKTAAPFRSTQLAVYAMSLFCLILFATAFERMGHYWRYYYQIGAFATLTAYSALFRLVPAKDRWRYLRAAIYLLVCGSILFYGIKAVKQSVELPETILAAFRGRTRFTTEEIDQYRRLQDSTPPGAPIFSILDWPLKFDSRRNKIYYHDPIASVSPPPGIPLVGEPADLVDYFRPLGIRYIACPGHQRLTERAAELAAALHILETRAEVDEWLVSQWKSEISFSELLEKVSRHYTLLFDDGKLMMIDLNSKVGRPTPTVGRGQGSGHLWTRWHHHGLASRAG
jgi:hypothetical protein